MMGMPERWAFEWDAWDMLIMLHQNAGGGEVFGVCTLFKYRPATLAVAVLVLVVV